MSQPQSSPKIPSEGILISARFPVSHLIKKGITTACDPNSLEAEGGEFRVQEQPRLPTPRLWKGSKKKREPRTVQMAGETNFLSCSEKHNRAPIETRRIQLTAEKDGICTW